MWWLYVIVPIILAAVFYGYSIRNTIKVAKPSCSSCPLQKENMNM